MRIIVFFDLPVGTSVQRREYNQFRRFLIKNGFLMMQESVYTKLVPNSSVADGIRASVRKQKPHEGIVQMLTITERQFNRMELLLGEKNTTVLDDDRRLVIL